MASSRSTNSTNAGTGTTPRPGTGGTNVVTAEDWEAWYRASHVGRRIAVDREADEYALAARRLRWRRAVAVTTGTAAALAVFSSGVLYADLRRPPAPQVAVAQPATSVIPAASQPAPSPSTVVIQAPTKVPVVAQPVGAVRAAPPVQLNVPALGINQRLVGLRVKADRQLDVPQSYDDIGWWSTGPVPGDPGAAVMVGHLDSKDGPAVFSALPSLTKGAVVSVRRADGTRVRFAVTKVQSFPKDDFPDKLVYRSEGRSSLHLVTCGGTYDRSAGGYRDNVVVFADLIKSKPAAKPKSSSTTKGSDKAKSSGKTKRSASSKASAKSGSRPVNPNDAINKAIRRAAKDARQGSAGAAKSTTDPAPR